MALLVLLLIFALYWSYSKSCGKLICKSSQDMDQPVKVEVYSKAEQDKQLLEDEAIIKELKLEQDLLLKDLAQHKSERASLLSEIKLLQQALETEKLDRIKCIRSLVESEREQSDCEMYEIILSMCSALDKCCSEAEQQCNVEDKLVILHSGLLFELKRICYDACYEVNSVVSSKVCYTLEKIRNLVINSL